MIDSLPLPPSFENLDPKLFKTELLKSCDCFRHKPIIELAQENFNKELNYIFALVLDSKGDLAAYDGCQFARNISDYSGMRPEVDQKVEHVFYYTMKNVNGKNEYQFICKDSDLSEQQVFNCYIWANDSLLSDKDRARFQFCFAHCYYSGIGVKKNIEIAVAWYNRAAPHCPEAAMMLGNCYEKGEGCKKDPESALGCYWQAATQSTNSDLIDNCAGRLEKAMKFDNAFEFYLKAVKLAPSGDYLPVVYLIRFCENVAEGPGAKSYKDLAISSREHLPPELRSLPALDLLKSLISAKEEKKNSKKGLSVYSLVFGE